MSYPNTLRDPTKLGTVEDVTGPTVRIKLLKETAHGIVFVNGEGYRIGQVGSFVRIPAGYCDLFGIVSQVGAGAAPIHSEAEIQPDTRWLRVELVGEARRGNEFQRGISQYPSIGDLAHIVTESDLRLIYTPGEKKSYVSIGTVASAESISAYINLNRFVTRHAAILGSTGAGKSTAVASLLASISEPSKFPSCRIVLLDLHGEYSSALGDRATVFKLNPNVEQGEEPLCIPFWALAFDELISVCFTKLDEKQYSVIADLVVTLKREALRKSKTQDIAESDLSADTPVPFSIKELWLRQHFKEHRMVTRKQGGTEDDIVDAFSLAHDNLPEEKGNAETLTPPKFKTSKTTGNREGYIVSANEGVGLKMQLASLHAKLKDPRLEFLFNPGSWSPDQNGITKLPIDGLLEKWLCKSKPITIFDLSGIPTTILDDLVGALLRLLFDTMFWGRKLIEGGRSRPLLVVLEEAHVYLSTKVSKKAAEAARRIAKEGRKYGIGMTLVSQRPSEIDPTILSQCGTLIALRLTNEADRSHVKACAADNMEGLLNMLPILRTGEAVIVGEAVSLPVRALITLPPESRRPDSSDPEVVPLKQLHEGHTRPATGWVNKSEEDYKRITNTWRHQNPSIVLDSNLPE